MERKELICIGCPLGCNLTVEMDGGQVVSVNGNTCKRGDDYVEETVKREVMEEVGLHVKNLRYYKSQPWAFSDTLLMGFFAEVEGDDSITLDREELALAEWFERENIPATESNISLTSEMIEYFRNHQE